MLLNNMIFISNNHERQNLPEEKFGLKICGLVAFGNKNIL